MSSTEIPEYTDDRARRLFERVYVGTRHGDATGHSWSWDSMNGSLKPTLTHVVEGSRAFCAYCGNRAYPIQERIGYQVTGFTCVCKGAMDEIEWMAVRQQMLDRHHDELVEMESAAPKADPQVLVRVVEFQAKALIKDIERGFGSSRLKGLGIMPNVGTPKPED